GRPRAARSAAVEPAAARGSARSTHLSGFAIARPSASASAVRPAACCTATRASTSAGSAARTTTGNGSRARPGRYSAKDIRATVARGWSDRGAQQEPTGSPCPPGCLAARRSELVAPCRARTVHGTSSARSYEMAALPVVGAAAAPDRRRPCPPYPVLSSGRARSPVPISYGARYELGTVVRDGGPAGGRRGRGACRRRGRPTPGPRSIGRVASGYRLQMSSIPVQVWAPHAADVALVVGDDRTPMTATTDGWWEHAPGLPAGTDYGFLVDGEGPYPDPRSAHQPHGVHGPSRTFDPHAHSWTDTG